MKKENTNRWQMMKELLFIILASTPGFIVLFMFVVAIYAAINLIFRLSSFF